jgi:winged helix-turn-helix DNA-binding protein
MAGLRDRENTETSRIMLGLLESVERDSQQTQRGMASELGIALGLVNAYLKRCITKGLVKISEAPARHYAYYLTPQGFAEKSRLTVDYLSYSFSLFRRARADYAAALTAARAKGFTRIILAGASDLAEIARICALNVDVEIVAVVDGTCQNPSFVGVPVFPSFDRVPHAFDSVVVTDLIAANETYREAVQRFGEERVFLPAFLGAPGSATSLAGE